MISFEGSRIARVRMRTRASADTLQQRLRATALIEQNALGGGGLPAQAVLVLRQLRAPLPQVLLRPGGGPTQPAATAWQGALRAQVSRAGAQAVRVVQGAVPADAGAVWFADQAELLSCLATDWLAGGKADAWWWRLLLGGPSSKVDVAAAWGAAPRYVPQAFEHLAQSRLALRFVAALPQADVDALTCAVLVCHALEVPAPAGGSSMRLEQPVSLPDYRLAVEGHFKAVRADTAAEQSIIDLVSATQGLWGSRALLLAISLALVRWPRQLRQLRFIDALSAALPVRGGDASAAWTSTDERGHDAAGVAVVAAPVPEVAVLRTNTRRSSGDELGHCAREAPATMAPEPEAVLPGTYTLPTAASRSETFAAASETGARWPQQGQGAAPAHPDSRAWGVSHTPAMPPPSAAATHHNRTTPTMPRILAQPDPPALLHCAQGGVFFLVNLALSLGLYSDFTRPRGGNLPLPLWDLLALCADAWLGENERDDALHALLAQLAGRDPDLPPATGFEPPTDWRVPAPGLRAWAKQPGAWRWHEAGGRLRVVHPAGFVVVDVERSTLALSRQLAAEASPYRAHQKLRLLQAYPAHELTAHAQARPRWNTWLLPLLARRLALAVGMQDSAAAIQVVCRVPARVALSPARLDVHMRLADLPIAVRCAGLDRDPGWIPAAGRDLRFHFDAESEGADA